MTFTSNYTSFCQNNVNCEGKYENSLIKEIVDNWAGSEFNENDLVQIDGYKARIMSKDDLFNHLGFYRANLSATSFTFTTDDYNFVFFHEPYWIMDMEEEDLYYHNAFAMKKTTSDRVHVSGEASSRAYNVTLKPVINIRKCLIEDNCDEITS